MNLFSSNNPWEPLASSSKPGTIIMRGCSVRFIHSIYLGSDKLGRYLFLLRLPEKDGTRDIKDFPNLKGTSHELLHIQDNYYFSLSLNDNQEWRIFQFLCQVIVTEIEKEERQNNKIILKKLHKILKKCTKFFGKNGSNFTREQALGLLGELYFMQERASTYMSWDACLESWKGPLGFPQDFLFPNAAVEIKTSEMSQKNTVRISNVEQLCPFQIKGYLYVINILEATDSSKQSSVSLNDLVEEITEKLQQSQSDVESFKIKLRFTGYTSANKYSATRYHISAEQCYSLDEDFPRIKAESLQKGIENVKYTLNLAACGNFKTTLDWIKS